MVIRVEPATAARFEDVRTVLGPKKPGAQGCWCLSYRLGASRAAELVGEERAQCVHELARRRAPGVLAYEDGQVLGWGGVAPLPEVHEFAHGRRYPDLADAENLWVMWCLRVVAGQGRRGVATRLVGGAAQYARSRGASGVVGFPIDNRGDRIDRTLASFGTLAMFERNGFRVVGTVDGQRSGHPQVAVRQDFG